MKAGAFFTSAILLGLSFSFSAFAQSAELTQSQTFFLPTLHGKQEVCKIPAKLHLLQDGSSSFSAGDLKDEKKLCEINFYQNVGICPKLNSTNPGVLISLIPDGMSKEVFEDKHCGDDDPSQKIKAKFKQSISCSYTASGLAAYQLSRLLGGGRVPVAVSRTMDKEEHKAVVEKALKILGGSSDVIATTWNQMNKAHSTVPLSSRLFNDQNQLYGFLSDNPTGEDQYTEVSGSGDYETRYQRFVQQPPFLRVSNPAGLAAIANSSEANKILPVLVQMKDVSDMVILDTLLSQDDRIGNIHFKYVWYIPENGQMTEEKSKARKPRKGEDSLINYRGFFTAIVPAEELKAMTAKGGILIKEMILKDNDCGVDVTKRSNMMRQISALEKLRHISPRTYTNVMRLAKLVKDKPGLVRDYFIKELLFTEKDYEGTGKSFLANLELVRATLAKNCSEGTLKLDLDRKTLIPGAAAEPVSCN